MYQDIAQADNLLRANRFKDCALVLGKIGLNPETAWRRAELAYLEVTRSATKPSKEDIRSVFREALECLHVAQSKDRNHANCIAWQGICTHFISTYDDMRERLKKSTFAKELWEQALKLNPNHPLANLFLGLWCFDVVEASGAKRLLNKTLGYDLPQYTYEEALAYLLKAEGIRQEYLIWRNLHISKCYDRLKNPLRARDYCMFAISIKPEGYLMMKANEEAVKHGKKFP